MRTTRNVLGQEFVNSYKTTFGASEPVQDFDDRNALYALWVIDTSVVATQQAEVPRRNDLQTVGMYPQRAALLIG